LPCVRVRVSSIYSIFYVATSVCAVPFFHGPTSHRNSTFTSLVQPHLKNQQLTSFQRQLNLYGFRMSNDLLSALSDQSLPHLAADLIKLPILSSFVGIILPLAAILSRRMHGDRAPLDRSICKRNEAMGMRQGAGGARIASDSIKILV